MYPPDHCHTESRQSSGQMKEGVRLYDYVYRKEACLTDTVSVQGRRAADFKTGCYFYSCINVTHAVLAHIIFY